MTAGHQVLSETSGIEYLAVEDDTHPSVLVAERLGSARDIDDRESAHGEADRAADIDPLVVGSTVR